MNPNDMQKPEGPSPSPTEDNRNVGGVPQETQATPQPQPTLPPKKSKKKWIIGIVAAVIVVLAAGGAVFGLMWYQNPEKMVVDAFSHAAKASSVTFDGSMDVTNQSDGGEESVNVTFDGRSAGNRAETNFNVSVVGAEAASGEELNMAGSAVLAGDDGLFFKLTNVREILAAIPDSQQVDEGLITIIEEKINDRWLKLDADSQEGLTREFEEQRQCVNNALKTFHENESQKNQLADAYRNNRILQVEKTGSEDVNGVPSDRFEINIDESKVDGFTAALGETEIVRALNSCTGEDALGELNADLKQFDENREGTKLEIWVSTWGHEFTQLRLSGTDTDGEASSDVMVRMKFNEEVNIETPTDATPVEDVLNELMQAVFSYGAQQPPSEPGGPSTPSVDQDLMLQLN